MRLAYLFVVINKEYAILISFYKGKISGKKQYGM